MPTIKTDLPLLEMGDKYRIQTFNDIMQIPDASERTRQLARYNERTLGELSLRAANELREHTREALRKQGAAHLSETKIDEEILAMKLDYEKKDPADPILNENMSFLLIGFAKNVDRIKKERAKETGAVKKEAEKAVSVMKADMPPAPVPKIPKTAKAPEDIQAPAPVRDAVRIPVETQPPAPVEDAKRIRVSPPPAPALRASPDLVEKARTAEPPKTPVAKPAAETQKPGKEVAVPDDVLGSAPDKKPVPAVPVQTMRTESPKDSQPPAPEKAQSAPEKTERPLEKEEKIQRRFLNSLPSGWPLSLREEVLNRYRNGGWNLEQALQKNGTKRVDLGSDHASRERNFSNHGISEVQRKFYRDAQEMFVVPLKPVEEGTSKRELIVFISGQWTGKPQLHGIEIR